MPTDYYYPETIAPHGINYNAWSNSGGANKNASTRPSGGRTGPPSHDDASTYIQSNADNQYQSLNLDWPGPIADLPSGFTFNCYSRIRSTVGSSDRRGRFVDPSNNTGSLIWSYDLGVPSGWVNQGQADVSASSYHPTGAAWSAADFTDNEKIQIRVRHLNAGTTCQCTSIWGQLQYTAASGGFVFLLGLAGLSALPFVGRFADLGSFMKYLEWRRVWHPRRTILTGEEVRQAWRELKEYTWPTRMEVGLGY
jgi:hypothetical protein